jgi:hypothetical protein
MESLFEAVRAARAAAPSRAVEAEPIPEVDDEPALLNVTFDEDDPLSVRAPQSIKLILVQAEDEASDDVNRSLPLAGSHVVAPVPAGAATPSPDQSESDEEVVVEGDFNMDSLHGGPPGSRSLTLKDLRFHKFIVDPSYARFDPAKPGSWEHIKVMTTANPHRREGQTHQCVAPMEGLDQIDGAVVVCGMSFTCAMTAKSSHLHSSARGVAFVNTPATVHQARYHKTKTKKRKQVDTEHLLAATVGGLATHEEALSDPSKARQRAIASKVMGRFVKEGMVEAAMSTSNNQKAVMCRWLVFTRQDITHNTFSCPDHKRVPKAGDSNYAAFWPKDVNNWAVKSFHILLVMIAYVFNDLDELHSGNPFWQANHDGVTVSHVKFQSFGAQLEWDARTWVLCMGAAAAVAAAGCKWCYCCFCCCIQVLLWVLVLLLLLLLLLMSGTLRPESPADDSRAGAGTWQAYFELNNFNSLV